MITVTTFKEHFVRDFPYLPQYVEGKAYFLNDIVYSEPNFYKSLKNGNLSPLSDDTAWELYNISEDSFLSDTDIQKAICEAKMSFNESLFDEEETDCDITEKDLALLYLTAYYLVVDIKNSTAGLSSNAYASFVSSKSVGSVSEGYGLPSWVNTSPVYAMYMTNGYGMKYLTFLIPRVSGFIYLSRGATTYD